MKKLVLSIILVLSLLNFASEVNAQDTDLLRGVRLIGATNDTLATDGNDTTYARIHQNDTGRFTLPQVTNVTAFKFVITNSLAGTIDFLDTNGKSLYSITKMNEYNSKLTTLTIEGVKSIVINSPKNFNTFVNTFELYGASSPASPPENVKATLSNKKITVTWDSVQDATSYYVYIDGVKSGLIEATSYTFDVSAERVYSIYVTAYNGFESFKSGTISLLADFTPPQATKLAGEALQEGGKIRISWALVADKDVSHYNVYKNDVLIQDNIKARQITLTETPGVKNAYSVTVVDNSGNESEKSNIVELTAYKIKDSIPPSKPLGLKGTAHEGYVALSWNANSEADLEGYYLYVNGSRYGDLITDTKIDVYGLRADVTYRFKIVAVDDSKNISQSTDEIYIKTLKVLDTTPPSPPKNLTATLASNYLSIYLSWATVNESDLHGYYVYVSDDNIVFNQINATALKDNSYNFTEIQGNQTYYFKVSAVDKSGNVSEKTNSVSVHVPERDPKEQVNKKNELLVTWNEIKGAVNYLIYFNGVLIATTDNQTFSFVIGEEYGYNGKPPVRVEVKAKFEDGSVGYDKNLGTQSKFGLSVQDLWRAVAYIVASVASILLLGLAIRFTPKAFGLIKKAVERRG